MNPFYLAELQKKLRIMNTPFMQNTLKMQEAFLKQQIAFAKSFAPLQDVTKSLLKTQLQLPSTYIAMLKSLPFQIPSYLKGFELLNISIKKSSENLYASINKMQNTFLKQDEKQQIPQLSFLVALKSSSAHFKILQQLEYYTPEYSIEIDNDIETQIDEEIQNAEIIIAKSNKDWLIPFQGAEQSLKSRNPDRIRHALTSLRELVTQILHELAPDETIQKSYKDANWYHNGKPTRRARLHYIINNKNKDEVFVKHFDKEIDCIISIFDLFQKGTHELISKFTDKEAMYIFNRVKLVIEQLL